MTPAHHDVVIVGGAVMGSAVAYFLSAEPDFDGSIAVVEKDRSFQFAASSRSTSGFRQQFSTEVNIRLSGWSARFLADAGNHLALDDDRPEIGICERGYLYLGAPDQVATFEANNQLQRALGVDALLLTPAELAARFPWLTVDDVAIGSLGLAGEGWFDGYSLMAAFARKARAAGVEYRFAEVVRIDAARDFTVGLADGSTITAGRVVLCAGTATVALAAQLGIDLPIHAVKQLVFPFSSPFAALDMPYVFAPDGLFCRPDGRDFIAGIGIAAEDENVALDDFDVDHRRFDDAVWPRLARRVQGFEEARPRGGWAGHYDVSLFDHNPFVGAIDAVPGLYLAAGFSGHGMMQSPGIGHAMAELITHGRFRTLDLAELGFDRIAASRPVFEGIQY